eukprot:12726689-Alexandrium_andersonii.AAC.1
MARSAPGTHTAVALSWFLCRELEGSAALCSHLTFAEGAVAPTVAWLLPVSKTDQAALGKER